MLQDVIKTAWNRNQLLSVLIELTYRCNLNCWFCYNDMNRQGRPLTCAQYTSFFEDLVDLGTLNLIFSGGEPLAHPEFFALGARARALGFVVRIKSNGHAIGKRLARRIRDEIDPFVIETSLHGADAATHDRQTGVPGSFDRLVANIGIMRDAGLRVKVNSCLTAWNEGSIERLYHLADKLGVSLQVDPFVTPRDDGDMTPLAISASEAGLRRLYAVQKKRSAVGNRDKVRIPTPGSSVETDRYCGAGASTVAVNPYGEVYPCVQFRRAVGNLHETSIKEIWERQTGALDEVRNLSPQVKEMVRREGLVGFCPGVAEAVTGDPLGIPDDVRRQSDLLRSGGLLEPRYEDKGPVGQEATSALAGGDGAQVTAIPSNRSR